jgi:hypothetical protein
LRLRYAKCKLDISFKNISAGYNKSKQDFLCSSCVVIVTALLDTIFQAYALYMKGCYLVEREQHWESALRSFTSARFWISFIHSYDKVFKPTTYLKNFVLFKGHL